MHRGAADYLAKDRLDGATIERSIRYAVERHRLMNDLRGHAAELGRRAEELQRMNDSLEQFVWAASHDLQTPLSSIIYRLQLYRMARPEPMDGAESIDIATDAAQWMSVLLNDLLHYVLSGTEDFRTDTIDCSTLISEVIERFATERHRAQIDTGPLPTLVGNRSMLGQVFQNLIQNAIVHATDNAPHVSIGADRCDAGWVFRVQDNGAGIEPDDLELIFQPFRRSGRSRESGSGIGLALCRRIIERHGGRIWCEPGPDGGAVFLFTVPDRDPKRGDWIHTDVQRTA
jgi:signal transduction histidine kinase